MLLSEGAAHPYQVEKMVQQRDMRYWTELSMSSIYKTLRQLEKKGLAASKASLGERNVGRRTYRLTKEGRQALREALREFAGEPEKIRWRIDLATSHLDLLTDKEIRTSFDSYAEELRKLIRGYQDLEKYLADDGCPEHAMALARRPLFLYKAELQWLTGYRRQLGKP